VSDVQVVVDCDVDEETGCQQLLAMHELRRVVERVAVPRAAVRRIAVAMIPTRQRRIREL